MPGRVTSTPAPTVSAATATGSKAPTSRPPSPCRSTSPAPPARGVRRREAHRRCPELVLLHRDEGRDVRAFEPVAVAAETVVAGVEVTRPGMLLLPAGGASHYHGSEHVLAEQLVTQVAELTGHESQVGVADGLLAAVLAARASLVVPPDASAAFLAPRGVSELLHAAAGER